MKRNVGKKIGIRHIILFMAVLIVLQNVTFLYVFSKSHLYPTIDLGASSSFNESLEVNARNISLQMENLRYNLIHETKELCKLVNSITQQYETDSQSTYMDGAMRQDIAPKSMEFLLRLLEYGDVSGAFLVLNSNNENAATTVYIRNDSVETESVDYENLTLEIRSVGIDSELGPVPRPSGETDIQNGTFQFNPKEYAFYQQPIRAALLLPDLEMEQYGYWSVSTAIDDPNEQAVYFSLPLIDRGNRPYGVLGIQISAERLIQEHLPYITSPTEDSFMAIVPAWSNTSSIEWVLSNNQVFQSPDNEYQPVLEPTDTADVYEVKLDVSNPLYCIAKPLYIYGENTPYAEQNWVLVGFVPKGTLFQYLENERHTILSGVVLSSTISLGVMALVVFLFNRNIKKKSKQTSQGLFNPSILSTHANQEELQRLLPEYVSCTPKAERKIETALPPLERRLKPWGGYELNDKENQVHLSKILHTLFAIEPGKVLDKGEWDTYYTVLTAEKNTEFENVYRLSEPYADEDRWLRIVEAEAGTGRMGIIWDVTSEVKNKKIPEACTDYDTLTNLYSRHAFKREVQARVNAAPDMVGAMIFSDVDNLKFINDTLGYEAGDRLIVKAGDMFREFEKHGGIVSRISGDEFAVFLHGFASIEEAQQLIYRQFASNSEYSLPAANGAKHRIRCSAGIAWYPKDSDNVTELIKLSDFAMYESKHQQKGTVREFDRESYENNAYLLENREAINQLLDESLVCFAFQPIVCLKTGEIYAYEALMRPMMPAFKSPAEILSVARAQSKLGHLERVIMLTAFETISRHAKELGGIKVFINSVPSQILSEEDYQFIARRYNSLLENIVIEITEEENQSPDLMSNKIAFVKNSKMKLALDDFGSGYSNELRILSMEPDIVKIDMGLIQGISHNQDKQKLVKNIISFAHSKGIELVAEGVEDQADLSWLVWADVDHVQGFYTGKPRFELSDIAYGVKNEILSLNKQKEDEQGHSNCYLS